MADDSSNNTSIVAIVVLVLLAVGIAYAFGLFNPREGADHTRVIEKPTVIEKQSGTEQPKLVNPK